MATKRVPSDIATLQKAYISNAEKTAKAKAIALDTGKNMLEAGMASGTAFLYGGVVGYMNQRGINEGKAPNEIFDGKLFKKDDGTGGVDIGLVGGALGTIAGAYMVGQKKRGGEILLGGGIGLLVPALHDMGKGIGIDMANKA